MQNFSIIRTYITIVSMRSFHPKKNFFSVSLYKGLSEFLPATLTWEIFSACFIVLDNLQEVFGCSIVTDFMLTMFAFSNAFGC